MSNGLLQPFAPLGAGKTATVAASSTSATANLAGFGESLLVTNAAAVTAFVQLGAGPATFGDVPVLPNSQRVLQTGPYVSQVAVVLNDGTGSVYFTPGTGAV